VSWKVALAYWSEKVINVCIRQQRTRKMYQQINYETDADKVP